jgi:hypothetical protein
VVAGGVHDVDQLVVFVRRAAVPLEELPAPVVEVDRKPSMRCGIDGIHGDVVHAALLPFG